MDDDIEAQRRKFREAAREAEAKYEAFKATAPLPQVEITGGQLDRDMREAHEQLQAALDALNVFDDKHPVFES